MGFYEFYQNNSGGVFHIDDNVAPKVYIEAESADEANEIARKSGDIYFDGVENGMDCECCGNRWHRTYEGSKVAETREELLSFFDELYGDNDPSYGMSFSTRVWYKNGLIEAIDFNK